VGRSLQRAPPVVNKIITRAAPATKDAWNAITMVKTDKLEEFFGITITNKYPGRASNDVDLTKLIHTH
jgi:hypothetical protein